MDIPPRPFDEFHDPSDPMELAKHLAASKLTIGGRGQIATPESVREFGSGSPTLLTAAAEANGRGQKS
jgi:hypothetical protein